MDPKDGEMLIVLAKELSITKAAEKLYISQPALSYRIKQIEKKFGAPIITRSQRGIQFTTEGEYVLNYAREMLTQLRKTKDLIENTSQHTTGTIRLGVSSNYAHYKLPYYLKQFLSKYPAVQIHVTTGWSTDIMELLRKEEIQLAIVRGNHLWNQKKLLLHQEPICIVSKKEINLTDLPNLPRIDYKTDRSLDTILDSWWFEHYDEAPNITMTVDKVETCKEMVKHGLGYAIIPQICLHDNDDLYMKYLKFNSQIQTRDTWLKYQDSLLELSLIKSFINFLKSQI